MARRNVPARCRVVTRQNAAEILRLAGRGYDRSSTSTVLWLYQNVVDKVMDDPGYYDTLLDYVAINRAHDGDLVAYQRLTFWERQVIMDWIGWELSPGEIHPLSILWRGPTWDYLYERIRRMKNHRLRKQKALEARQAAQA